MLIVGDSQTSFESNKVALISVFSFFSLRMMAQSKVFPFFFFFKAGVLGVGLDKFLRQINCACGPPREKKITSQLFNIVHTIKKI